MKPNNFKKLPFGLTAFVGFIIILCLITWGSTSKATTPKPKKLGTWTTSPIIEVCNSSPVKLPKVIKAAMWWKKLGYSFEDIRPQTSTGPCVTGNLNGYIIIDELISSSFKPGTTWVYVHDNDEIKWAKVKITDDQNRIIEHELGHALGWAHVDIPGHIMHPNLQLGGWQTQGLK